MNVVFSQCRRLSLCALSCLVASCAMPPRDAWRIVQKHGLIPYMMGGYPALEQNRYLATSAPLQKRHDTEVPYRPEEPRVRENVVPYAPREDKGAADSPSKSRAENASERQKDAPPTKPKNSMDSLPYGTPVTGRPGMVMSPFASKEQLVDVTGMSAGDPVKCPYTGKLFRVPPTQQAAAGSLDANKAVEPPPPPLSSTQQAPAPAPTPAPSSPPSAPAPAKP